MAATENVKASSSVVLIYVGLVLLGVGAIMTAGSNALIGVLIGVAGIAALAVWAVRRRQ